MPALLLTGCVALVAGCGGGQSMPVPVVTTPVMTTSVADPCAETTPPPRQPSLILCLSGAVTGSAQVPNLETTSCTGSTPGNLSGTFVTLVNSVETRLEFQLTGGSGRVDLNDPAADVAVTVVQAARNTSWSSIGGSGRFGALDVAPDRSGVLEVTLPQRDLEGGQEEAGAPTLTVRGTFRCPAG